MGPCARLVGQTGRKRKGSCARPPPRPIWRSRSIPTSRSRNLFDDPDRNRPFRQPCRGSGRGPGHAARMEPRRPLCRHGRSRAEARPGAVGERIGRLRGDLQGQARRAGGGKRRGARKGGRRLREARRAHRPHHLLCRPAPCRRYQRPRPLQVLWRRAGEDYGGERPPAVFPAGTEPHRRRRAGGGDGRPGARPLPAVAGGRAGGEALPARGSRRASLP